MILTKMIQPKENNAYSRKPMFKSQLSPEIERRNYDPAESFAQRCSVKMMFLKISQNSQENASAGKSSSGRGIF